MREHNQAPGQGQSKGSNKRHKEHSSPGPVSQSNAVPKPYPMGPSNLKEKPRDRPLSAPSQAAIQELLSPDPQLMEPQPLPQVQSGSKHVFSPVVRLVSARPRGRSHSPRCRIDVDIEPDYQSGWSKGMRPAVSSECLTVPSEWEVTEFDPIDPLSQSFPEHTLQAALPRQRSSYSPTSNHGNFLQVPDENNMLSPPFNRNISGRYMQNAMRGSSSTCDLSASAPADILRQNLAERRLMNCRSFDRLASRHPNTSTSWLGLSPRTSPQTSPSYSPTSSSPKSSSFFSPPYSPDNLGSNMNCEFSPPTQSQLLLPEQSVSPFLLSPSSSPYCSPYGSPFGSQTQICIRSVGAEC